MQKKLAKDIVTLKKDGAKRHQQIFNLQSSIFNSGLSGLGVGGGNQKAAGVRCFLV